MKSDCERIQALLPEAARLEVDEGARAVLQEHVESCRDCAEAQEFVERLHAALADDPLASPPDVYFESVLAEIHRRMPAAPRAGSARRRFVFSPQWAATAVMAILCLVWAQAAFQVPGASLVAWLERPPARAVAPAALKPAQAAAMGFARVALVAVPRLGLVAENSEILRLSADMRRELGLPAFDLAKIRIRI